MTTETTPARIGPITLAAGVRPAQIFVFLIVIMAANCMLIAVPLLKAYVFSEMMHIPKADVGRLTGNLSMVQQIAVLVFILFTGAMADRIGRRKVLMMAMVGYIATLILYPLASSVIVLFALHFMFGVASTGHTAGGPTMMMDYPANASRGKFLTLAVVTQAIANLFVVNWLAAHIPLWLTAAGMSANEAGRYAFWVIALIGGLGLAVAIIWLREPPHAQQPGGLANRMAGFKLALSNVRKVAAHARVSPEFGLVMAMGCVIRSDTVVLTAFLSLWVMQAANAQGVSTIEALAHAGLVSSTFQLATVFAPLLFGWVADRVNRVAMLVLMLLLTGFALISTYLVTDVMGWTIFVVIGIVGVTESGLVTAAQTLMGERSPPELRGSAYAMFAFLGTTSTIAVSAISGVLFDKLGRTSPFIMVGSLNLMFAMIGLWLVLRRRGRAVKAVAIDLPAASGLTTAGHV